MKLLFKNGKEKKMREWNVAMTTDFAGESKSTDEIFETLKKIADAGFSYIHWCHEWDSDYTYSKEEMDQIHNWMNDLGLSCKGVHATEGSRRNIMKPNHFHYRFKKQNRRDYTSENEYNRRAGVELIRNRVQMAEILGTDAIVLHMQLPYKSFEADGEFRECYYRQVFKSFDELENECRRRHVRICIENMLGTPDSHQIEQFDRMFERYSLEFVAFTYDCGHGNVTEAGSFELVKRYQDRLYMMHLHDNHGLHSEECWEDAVLMGRCDEHRNPFTGNIDFEELAKIIAGSPYELPIVLEVAKKDDDEKEFLEESLAAGKRITKMILDYRNEKRGGNGNV